MESTNNCILLGVCVRNDSWNSCYVGDFTHIIDNLDLKSPPQKNAAGATKAKADYITRSNEEDGVAHVLQKFCGVG